MFAKQGFIQLTEYSFKLTDAFNKMNERERTIGILITIPYDLTMMFKEDIFSSKLSPVFISALNNEKDKVKRHLLASLLIYKQPDGWNGAILNYMDSVGHNSYYLGTLLDLMLAVYQNGELDESEQMRMKNLIRAAVFKNSQGRLPSTQGEYNQIELSKKYLQGNGEDDNKEA